MALLCLAVWAVACCRGPRVPYGVLCPEKCPSAMKCHAMEEGLVCLRHGPVMVNPAVQERSGCQVGVYLSHKS